MQGPTRLPWLVALALQAIAPTQADAQLRLDEPRSLPFVEMRGPLVSGPFRAATAASLGDDDTSVVVTWTALGLTAGLISGAVTWFVDRRR
jgi:hypothetical protein